MSANEEKTLFRLLEAIEQEAGSEQFKDVEPSLEEPLLDAQAIERIRAKTFAKLGLDALPELSPSQDALADSSPSGDVLTPLSATGKRLLQRRRRLLIAAAVAGLCLLAGALSFYASPDVRAQVRKMLQFIPGYGTVQLSEDNEISYILPTPVTQLNGTSRIDIRGVFIGNKQSSISLTGTGTAVESIELANASGDRYKFKSAWTANAGDWTGGYYYTGPIKVTEEMSVSFDGSLPVVIRLKPAEKVERVEELGVTDERSGIALTAVTSAQNNGKVRVTLVPQLAPGSKIESYGLGSYEHIGKPKLDSEAGQAVAIEQDENFPNPNEFVFVNKQPGPSGYKLLVPEVALVRRVEEPIKLTIPIPSSGVLELNRQWDIAGFPVKVLRVERLADTTNPGAVRIDFDLSYDRTATESLLYFFHDLLADPKIGSFSFKLNEDTQTMEHMTLSAKEYQEELTLYVTEAHTVVRGPWEFELKAP